MKIGARISCCLIPKLRSQKINSKSGSIQPATLELTPGSSASLARQTPRALRKAMGLKTERLLIFAIIDNQQHPFFTFLFSYIFFYSVCFVRTMLLLLVEATSSDIGSLRDGSPRSLAVTPSLPSGKRVAISLKNY